MTKYFFTKSQLFILFAQRTYSNTDLLFSPDSSGNPLLWREPKAKIVAHSGREVVMKNNRSAPKKKAAQGWTAFSVA